MYQCSSLKWYEDKSVKVASLNAKLNNCRHVGGGGGTRDDLEKSLRLNDGSFNRIKKIYENILRFYFKVGVTTSSPDDQK